VEDDVDIGIVPSHGLVPPTLHISDLERCRNSETKFNYSSGFSGTKSSRPQTSTTQNNSSQTESKVVQRNNLSLNFKTVAIIFFTLMETFLHCVSVLICSLKDSQVMNAVPSTAQEVADCNRTLTAQELYQVDIGRPFLS